MKKLFFVLLIVFLFLFENKTICQEYRLGLGFRGGINSGISGKMFVYKGDKMFGAFEAIVGMHYKYKGYSATVLYELQHEIHIKSMRYATLYYFVGIGLHGGMHYNDANKLSPGTGADAIAGLEYIFADFPVSIGLDIRPYLDLYKDRKFFPDAAVTIRWVLK